ncbi:MAG TPA: CsgG/HfaB family protein [Deltaproteobacteria bacterium]|nr:CsgG/HfaB family protein [Deltaproteobacteria bacterium]
MHIRKTVLLGLCTLMMAGCASPGKESFDIGRELERQQRLEDALPMYEEALAKDAGNTEFKAAADMVRGRLSKRLLETARQLMAATPQKYEDLRKAQEYVNRALKYDPSSADARSMSEALKAQMDAMVKKAETAYGQAVRAQESKDWVGALHGFRDVRSYYPNYMDVATRIPIVESHAMAFYLNQAEHCRADDDLDGQIRHLESALMLQPANSQVAAVLKEARSANTVAGNLKKAEQLARENRWDRMRIYLKRAQAMQPGKADVDRINRLSADVVRKLIDRASTDLDKKAVYSACVGLKGVYDFSPAASKTAEYSKLRSRVVADVTVRVEELEAAGNVGQALFLADCVSQLVHPGKQLQHKMQGLKDKVRQKVVKKIAIMDFSAPASNADAGRLVTDSLLSYMTRNASRDVKILARDVLGTLIKEIEMGQAGLYDIESAKKSGKLKGTDVFIFGSLLQYAVEKNVEEGHKTVVAKVGIDKMPNPQYNVWMAANPQPTEEDRRHAPPAFIEKDRTETIRYKVATHRKNANVTISFRVIDVESGEVVITRTLKSKKEAIGTYSEGVDVAGIPYKRLELPSDADLLEKAVDESISNLGHQVLSRFQNLQEGYLNSGDVLKKKGEPLMAVERYVDAIVSEEVKNLKSPVTEKARREIDLLLKQQENYPG